MEFNL